MSAGRESRRRQHRTQKHRSDQRRPHGGRLNHDRRFVQQSGERAHLRGDGALVWAADWEEPRRRIREVQRLLRALGRSLEAD